MREELKDMKKMEDVDVFAEEVAEQELPEMIEENGLIYYMAEDGCYYPDLTFEQETDYPIGKYGLIRAEYMWEHRAHEYRMMLQDGTWNRYLHEVDDECHREVEQAVRRIMEKEGVDERLKAENPLEWVRRVNAVVRPNDPARNQVRFLIAHVGRHNDRGIGLLSNGLGLVKLLLLKLAKVAERFHARPRPVDVAARHIPTSCENRKLSEARLAKDRIAFPVLLKVNGTIGHVLRVK